MVHLLFKVSAHKGRELFLVVLHLSKQVTWPQLISKRCSVHLYHVLRRRRKELSLEKSYDCREWGVEGVEWAEGRKERFPGE